MSIPGPSPLGKLLKQYRRNAALSQDELADRSGVSARTISDLERGQRPSAHLETLRLLAEALNLSAEERAKLIQTAQAPLIETTLRPHSSPPGAPTIPVPATRLVGREQELDEISLLLSGDDCRLLTLVGPGGVGKTRLALAVAADAQSRLAGHVLWVDLAPVVDPRLIAAAIADRIGIVQTDSDSLIGTLATFFNDHRSLLVLDNFEHLIEAAPIVGKLLAGAPLLTLLATSRAPLRLQAEIEYAVAPLKLPELGASDQMIEASESVRLFIDRARAVQRHFVQTPDQSRSIAEICRRLDGIPLAIELAASRVKVLSPQALLERLDQPLPLLTRGALDAPPRQQTMEETIAWSYNLLDSEAQWLFRQLSVFVGGFTLDAVEWVIRVRASHDPAAIDALEVLCENSLITRLPDTPTGPRYSMYETIREFGLARLRELCELESAYDRHAAYCRRLAYFTDEIPSCIVPLPWLRVVDQERANIRAAHRYLAKDGNAAKLLEFIGAYGHYLFNRGPLHEAWEWFDQGLSLSASEPIPASIRLRAVYWGSHLTSNTGQHEKALALAIEALGLAQTLGDLRWEAAITHCLALINERIGNLDEAANLYEKQIKLWEAARTRGLTPYAYIQLGEILFSRGQSDRARLLLRQAGDMLAEMGGTGWVGVSKATLGFFAISDGDLRDAAALFSEGLKLAIEAQASIAIPEILVGLAVLASELGQHEIAVQLLGAADAGREAVGVHLGPSTVRFYSQAKASSQSTLGETGFSRAYERGRASDQSLPLACAEEIDRITRHWPGDSATSGPLMEAVNRHSAAD
jgi:predicted ATPase/DNA-binding XRE family transcriptional regulator